MFALFWMEGHANLGLLFQEKKKKGYLVKLPAGCCLPASRFIIFPSAISFTMTLQALLLKSVSYFFNFSKKMAKRQVDRQCSPCLRGKEPQEELAAELGVAEEYKHKLLLRGGNDKELISNCVSISGTPLSKSTMNYMYSNINLNRIWFVWLKKHNRSWKSSSYETCLTTYGTHVRWSTQQLPEPLQDFLALHPRFNSFPLNLLIFHHSFLNLFCLRQIQTAV